VPFDIPLGWESNFLIGIVHNNYLRNSINASEYTVLDKDDARNRSTEAPATNETVDSNEDCALQAKMNSLKAQVMIHYRSVGLEASKLRE